MRPGERLLVWRLKRGDRDACSELIRRHHRSVYGYLRRLGAGTHLAEDLTQETYAKAWANVAGLREAASLRSWLLTIARNELMQWVRREGRDLVDSIALPDLQDPAESVDETLAREQRNHGLRQAVARLEPTLQEVIALHYFHELSLREVAAITGIASGTVKSRLNRALETLRHLLRNKEADNETPRSHETTEAVCGTDPHSGSGNPH